MNGPTVLELPREPMPDIASAPHQGTEGALDWVGMSEVHQPLRLRDGDATHPVDARASIYVDLRDPRAKASTCRACTCACVTSWTGSSTRPRSGPCWTR
jgi:hypothetical protein